MGTMAYFHDSRTCNIWSGWYLCKDFHDSKLHGANKGPIWGRQDPGGPNVGPMNFVIWGRIGIQTYDISNQVPCYAFNRAQQYIWHFSKYLRFRSWNSFVLAYVRLGYVICSFNFGQCEYFLFLFCCSKLYTAYNDIWRSGFHSRQSRKHTDKYTP